MTASIMFVGELAHRRALWHFSLSIMGSEAWAWQPGIARCIAVTLIAADIGLGAMSCYQSIAVVGREHLKQSSQG